MSGRRTIGLIALAALAAAPAWAQQEHAGHPQPPQESQPVEAAINQSMAGHQHHGPHFRLTTLRAETPEDCARADAILNTLREAIEKYKDVRVAEADGYRIFAPDFPQPEYHFTNYWYGALAAFNFDPARPTSLLYRKTADGFELAGAMYTASRLAGEDDLDARIPLSVTRWHAHVNICLPPAGEERTADWTRYGPRGAIAAEEDCRAANGRWRPQIFGWMVHVYPYESSPERIWPR